MTLSSLTGPAKKNGSYNFAIKAFGPYLPPTLIIQNYLTTSTCQMEKERHISKVHPLLVTSQVLNICCLVSTEGTNVVTFCVFWLFSAMYIFVDFTGRPKWALQYKIQDGSNQPVSFRSSYLIYYV